MIDVRGSWRRERTHACFFVFVSVVPRPKPGSGTLLRKRGCGANDYVACTNDGRGRAGREKRETGQEGRWEDCTVPRAAATDASVASACGTPHAQFLLYARAARANVRGRAGCGVEGGRRHDNAPLGRGRRDGHRAGNGSARDGARVCVIAALSSSFRSGTTPTSLGHDSVATSWKMQDRDVPNNRTTASARATKQN